MLNFVKSILFMFVYLVGDIYFAQNLYQWLSFDVILKSYLIQENTIFSKIVSIKIRTRIFKKIFKKKTFSSQVKLSLTQIILQYKYRELNISNLISNIDYTYNEFKHTV